jgi:hypothetical protein
MTLLTQLPAKLVTRVMGPRYLHKKQIKLNYETQYLVNLMLNDEIEKRN